jgi:Tfp pilus assembly protein PilZ
MMICRCEAKGYSESGYVVDISYGGAGITGTSKLPEAETELLLTIRLPWSTIEMKSRVVWVKPDTKSSGLSDFGVEFLGSHHDIRSKLSKVIPE